MCYQPLGLSFFIMILSYTYVKENIMQKYLIITDTCANLTDETINKYQIPLISLSFIYNDKVFKSYENGKSTDLKAYYELLRNKERITTSAVNSDEVFTFFNNFLKEGYDILYIGFSSKLSNTFNICKLELEYLIKKYPDRKILYVDSLSGSLGQGLLVEKAYELKVSNKTIDEIFIWLERNKLKVLHLFTVESLYHFFQGGRVSRASYFISNILDIKPILHCTIEGRLEVIGKAIGRKRSLLNIVNRLVDNITNPKEQMIYIAHADCIDSVEVIKKLILEKIEVKGFVVNNVDLVVGAHAGPGTIALFFFGENR